MAPTIIAAALAGIAGALVSLGIPPLAAVGLVAGGAALVATLMVAVVSLASREHGRVWRELASSVESSLRRLLR